MYPTLVFAGQTWTPQAICDLSNRISSRLNALGIRERDTVAVMMKNCPAYVATAIACRRAGIYLVSINWHFKALETGFILRDSGARVLLCHEDLVAQIEEGIPFDIDLLLVPTDETTGIVGNQKWSISQKDQPLPDSQGVPFNAIVYTSGTTGKSKGVRRLPVAAHERADIDAKSRHVARTVYGVTSESVALLSAPMYHSAAMSFIVHSCNVGAKLLLEPGFNPERTLELIDQYRVTHAYLVPTMYQRLLALPKAIKERYNTTTLQQVSSTGSPCAPELKLQMIGWFGPVITEAYGSSEAGYTTFIDSKDWLAKPGSAGRVLGAAEISIIGDGGAELAPGEVGLIYVRQPAMPDFTYIGRDDERVSIGSNGLVTLGDMGYLDEDGFLFICDRQSDMIISGGVNIYSAEIEAALVSLSGIADAAVFGIPDTEFGESVAAAVQLEPNTSIDAQTIQAKLRAQIANYKVPRTITFHDALPREDTGKIFKRRLREPYWHGLNRGI